MELLKKLNVRETTVNADTDLENGVAMYKLIEYLEELNQDSTYLFDVNIDPLLDYFVEGGFTEKQIIEMNNQMYGNFIEITYYKDIEMYVLEYGVR